MKYGTRVSLALRYVWLLTLVACQPAQTTPSIQASPQAPTATASPPPLPAHTVWFTPNYDGDTPDFVRPADGLTLFDINAPWPVSRSRLDVFKFYIDAVKDDTFPLEEAVQTLTQENIAIAVEAGGIRDWNCSGAAMANIELQGFNRIVGAGGKISYLAIDSPFGHTLATGIQNPCGYTIEQASEQLVVYISAIRKQFPEIRIGLIEPVIWYSVSEFPSNPGAHYGDLIELLDTFLGVLTKNGESIDFFHADSPYDYTNALSDGIGWIKLKTLQDFVHSKGLRFGLIYNSDRAGRISDEDFYNETLLSRSAFAQVGGDPDESILASWYQYPRNWLPEDQPFTFTYLLRRFLDAKLPGLTLQVDPNTVVGSLNLSGILQDQDGLPVTNASIQLSAIPLDGSGVYGEYTLSGTVPIGAVQGVASLRINSECQLITGTSEIAIYKVSYVEGTSDANLIANNQFVSGTSNWGIYGTGISKITKSDHDQGSMLMFTATHEQTMSMDSPYFSVQEGLEFNASFAARVAPSAQGTGCFAIIFLGNNGEVSRVTVPFEVSTLDIETVVTDASGAYSIETIQIPAGTIRLQATFTGNETLLPITVSQTVEN